MNAKQLREWWNRPMSVTVKDLCPRCRELKEGVKNAAVCEKLQAISA